MAKDKGKNKSHNTNKLKIAVIPGDGIGNEVVPEGMRVLEAAGRRFDIDFKWDHFDWSCERYKKKGAMMPEDGLDRLREHDAIYLGAVGYPGVPDHISLWGLLIPIRRSFQQYINLRPVRLFKGLQSPLADRKPGDIDYLIVRENNEGEYSSVGGRMYEGTPYEMVVQQAIFTRRGCDRVMRYAFDLAMSRKRRELTSATKSNGISISMPYWDERFAAIGEDYPKVKTQQFHIDILTAHLVRNPHWFDVIVGSNLFGDILSDLGPATTGTIAIAPGANIKPVDVRAGAWLRARHRRPRDRQPDRADLVRRHDARPLRSPRSVNRHRWGDRAGDRGTGGADAGHGRYGIDQGSRKSDRGDRERMMPEPGFPQGSAV